MHRQHTTGQWADQYLEDARQDQAAVDELTARDDAERRYRQYSDYCQDNGDDLREMERWER